MNDILLAYSFIKEITDWISKQSDIQVAALVGSYANDTATQESDIDLVIVTKEPIKYIADIQWAVQFGNIERQQCEDYGLVTSLRVWYTRGLEVEYGITDLRWTTDPLDEGTREVIKNGIQVLFERGNILSRHLIRTKL